MNDESIVAYPLCWPSGWKRTSKSARVRGRFNKKELRTSQATNSVWRQAKDLSIADAVVRTLDSLDMFGVPENRIVISTNVQPRLDGLPRSGKEAEDPGVAVYWTVSGKQRCMAIDRYDRVADNIAAVAATLEAMRAIERHGGAEILDRAFLGFQALAAPGERPWRAVLGIPNVPLDVITIEMVEDKYRTLVRKHHPDVGGDQAEMAALNGAIRQAREELSK